jgi:transposase
MSERRPYSTDLTDRQWQHLEPLLPAVRHGGRPAHYSRREIVNAILYVTRNGCAWRNLPHDLPPWSLVYNYFWRWQRDGVWQAAHSQLVGDLRQIAGRTRLPSAAILDSQSVKTTEKGGLTATMAASASTGASGI